MDPLAHRVLARFLESYGTPGGWQHRKEKEEEVVVSLPPHLQTLWRRTKHQFKGTPHQRLEKFLQYVHDHEGEDMRVLQEEADDAVAKMVKEYERRPPSEDDVPFSG